MNSGKNPLQKQLDQQKFLHAAGYVQKSSRGIKKLTSSELAHLNQMISGSQEECWRLEPMEVVIPTGQKIHFNVVNNPIHRAREIIGTALQMAGNQEIFPGASYLYSQLVLEHLFKLANRRTAVLATLWLLVEYGVDIDAKDILEVDIGDLRNPQNLLSLSQKIARLQKT